jgi:general secretion pathway protein A
MDYGQYYGFSRMPFGEGPDREVFFPSETHKEALASMLFGIKERKGYIVIFGGQGLGKTMLIRQVMDQLGEGTRVALIEEAHDRYYALLKELMKQLGLGTTESSKGPMLHELYEYLIRCLEKGENVVVFLDDAHRMKDEIVEELRLMSNLETSRTKLIQIVIVGEPELDQRLSAKHLRQIRQRIQILHRLLPLGPDESRQYIEHRLAWAGGSSEVFTPEALAALCKYAGGIPRNLNALCDHALTLGLERSEKPVSAGTVRDARKAALPLLESASSSPEFEASGKPVLRSPWLYAALAAAVAFLFLGGYYYMGRTTGIAPWSAFIQPQTVTKAPVVDPGHRAQPQKKMQTPDAPAPKPLSHPAPTAATIPGPATQEPAETSAPVKEVTVTEGATLSSIATRHYGIASATALDCILEANPEIADVDLIRTGSQVILPQAAGNARLVKRTDGTFAIHAATLMTHREARDYCGKIGSDLGKLDIVKKGVGPQKNWYRIMVGPFASREEARNALQALERLAPP